MRRAAFPTTPRPRKNGALSSGITVRETTDTVMDRGILRRVVIVVGPGELLGFRLKGTRRVEETNAGACYAMALKARVALERAAKAATKPGAHVLKFAHAKRGKWK